MNPDKWESVDSIETGSGVMVSNLPLLFAHGMPTSLQHMNLMELEVFVPFMVRCSVGEDLKTVWSQLPRPVWWPSRLPFRIPSCPSPAGTRSLMVRLIERCYAFHGCQYLIQFCTSLYQMQPSVGYRFTDNRDGTTSMYHGVTGKLLVTFRNENREYDKSVLKPKKQLSSQKKLLPSSSLQSSTKNGVMVRPPVSDVFLCDKCDDEFVSLKEVQSHERQCKGNRPLSPKLPSPEPEIPDEEQDNEDQVPFLSYLGLKPEEHTGISPYMSPRKRQNTPVKKAISQSYMRFDTIDIASPLGRYILSNLKYGGKLQMPQHQVSRYERYVHASPEYDSISKRENRSINRWIVVWKPRKEDPPWAHAYCFTSDQRREKIVNLHTGLDQRSRKLLCECRGVRVKLKRLAKRIIDRATRLGGRSALCIDLTSGEDSPSSHAYPSDAHTLGLFPPHNSAELMARDPLLISNSDYNELSDYQFPTQSQMDFTNHTQVHPSSRNMFLPVANGTPFAESSSDWFPFPPQGPDYSLDKLSDYGVTVSNVYAHSVFNNNALIPFTDAAFPPLLHPPSAPPPPPLPDFRRFGPSPPPVLATPPSPQPPLSKFRFTRKPPAPGPAPHDGPPPRKRSRGCGKEGDPLTSSIEVIDLSSDEEEVSRKPSPSSDEAASAAAATGYVGGADLANRSYARSKNGYSHWSSKGSPKRGREPGHSMINGTTLRSVPPPQPSFLPPPPLPPPPPPPPPFSPNLTSTTSSLTPPINHPSLLPMDISYSPLLSWAVSHASSFFHTTESPEGEFLCSVPKIRLDDDGLLKAPLQIDEDISFNLPLADSSRNLLLGRPDMEYLIQDLRDISCNNNNYEDYDANKMEDVKERDGILNNIVDKINKSFYYLKSFVKSSIFDEEKLVVSPESVRTEDWYARNTIPGRAPCPSQYLNHSGPEGVHPPKGSNAPKTVRSPHDTLPLPLLETKRRSVAGLNGLNARERRRLARNVLTPDPDSSRPKKNGKAHKCRLTAVDAETETAVDEDRESSAQRRLRDECDAEEDPSHYYHEFRKRKTKPKYQKLKRPKLSRELKNLASDEYKELKDSGFHPTDILGSYHSPIDHRGGTTPPENQIPPFSPPKRLTLLPLKGDRQPQAQPPPDDGMLRAGSKKLARELAALIGDEMKTFGCHPSQIAGNLLALQRNGRSGLARATRHDPNKEEEEVEEGEEEEEEEEGEDDYSVFSLSRTLRNRGKTPRFLEEQNPRKAQREMIRMENAMCVFNYALANIT